MFGEGEGGNTKERVPDFTYVHLQRLTSLVYPNIYRNPWYCSVAESLNGQDNIVNHLFWLAIPAGKMGLHVQVVPCPLKISCLGWKKKFFFGHIINPCTDKAYSFKMTGYWPHFVLHFKARVSASQQGFIVHSPHPVLML